MTGCGDSHPISVAITPSVTSTSFPAGTSAITLTSTVTNDSKNGGVTWSLSPSSGCGTLTATTTGATYTPPTAASLNSDCTATITAASSSDIGKTASVSFTVKAISISISSSSGTTTTFGEGAAAVTLTATLGNEASGATDTPTWSMSYTGGVVYGIRRPQIISNPCGALSGSGTTATYTPPSSGISTACVVTIKATSSINTNKTATTTFTINPISVAITSPTSAITEFADGSAVSFTATITNDGSSQGLTWSATNSCGTVAAGTSSTSATFTPNSAITSTCTGQVIATSALDSTKYAALNVTVNPTVSVTATPASTALDEGGSTTVTATVTHDLNSAGVSWSLSPASGCGSLSNQTTSGVTYSTPSTLASACTATITAKSNADTTKSSAATPITVTPTDITLITPSANESIAANTALVPLMARTSHDGSQLGVTWTISPTTGCGSIVPSGNTVLSTGTVNAPGTYYPPTESSMSAACTATLKAASTYDSSHYRTVAVTVNPISVSSITSGGSTPPSTMDQNSSAIPLSAVLSNDINNGGVAFSFVSGNTCGTLGTVTTSDGITYSTIFTPKAPQTAQCDAKIVASSITNSARTSATITISVLPLTISLSPSTTTGVTVSGTHALTATIANDALGGSASWTLTPLNGATSCGSLTTTSGYSGTNTFTAPATSCKAQVTVTAQNDSTKTASVELDVSDITVSIAPTGPWSLDASNSNGSSQLNLTGTIVGASGITWSSDNTGCAAVVGSTDGSTATVTAVASSTLTSSCTANIKAAYTSDATKYASYVLTATPVSVSVSPNTTQTVSGQTTLNVTATVANDAVPGPGVATSSASYYGVTWSLSPSTGCGTLSTTGPTASVTYTAPATACTATITATSNADTSKSSQVGASVTAASTPLLINTTQNDIPGGVVSNPMTVYIDVTGGSNNGANYSLSFSGPSFLALSSSNTLALVGTPAASDTGSKTLTVTVTDSSTKQTTSTSYTLTVASTPTGHESWVSGRYSCMMQGYVDSDSSRWGSLMTFYANGAGTISAGTYDAQGRSIGLNSGTVAGTYTVGTDNLGTATLTFDSSTVHKYAIAVNNLSTAPASAIRITQTDDAGASPSGQHGSGVCYLDTTSAFASSTLTSNGVAFQLGGEDGAGLPKGMVGYMTFSSGSVSGLADQAKDQTITNSISLSGTYTTPPDSTTGTFTISVASTVLKVYIVDASRMFVLEANSSKPTGGLNIGQMRARSASSYDNSNLSGAFVLYEHAHNLNSSTGAVDGYSTFIAQGSGNGSTGMTMNASYRTSVDTSGNTDYAANDSTGTLTANVVSSGRTSFTPGANGSVYMYLYGTNKAVVLDTSKAVGLGWAEPQSNTTFTPAAIAGSYMFGSPAALNVNFSNGIGVVTSDSSGNTTGNDVSASEGWFSWDEAINATLAADSSYGSYGVMNISRSGSVIMNCIDISTSNFVCIQVDDNSPNYMLMQK